MSTSKVAIVTGSNKGIGFAIVKGLCQKFDGDVYLTSRDVSRGKQAVEQLNQLGLHPKFHQLDVNDQNSVDTFQKYLKDSGYGIDILVNNAAIAYKGDDPAPFEEQARETVKVNYFSLLRVCHALFPLLKPHARVVNVSSSAGQLLRIPGENIRERFSKPNITEAEISELMEEFVKCAKEGKNVEKGWGTSAYSISKVGVSAVSFAQQRDFDKDPSRLGIVVNAVHPGYVDTDMTSHKGPLTIEEGAEAPLFLALQPVNENEIKGKFVWYTKEVILNWYKELKAT